MSPTTTLSFNDREADIVAHLKSCTDQLRHDYSLSAFAEQLLALHTGRAVFPGADSDKRRTLIPASWVKGFRGLATMFSVDSTLEYVKRKHLFDAAGWRLTSWPEISRLGVGCRHHGPFTYNQIRRFLKILAKAGYIERVKIFNAAKKTSQLFLRFRADRIIADIEKIQFHAKNKMTIAPKVPESEAILPAKTNEIFEPSTVVHHAKLINNKQPVSSVHRSVPDAELISPVSVVENSEETAPSGRTNFSPKASERGDETLRPISTLIQSEFSETEFDYKHLATLRRWVFSGQGNQKMTIVDVQHYFHLRNNCNPGGWEFSDSVTLSDFLKFWPAILRRMRCLKLQTNPDFGMNLKNTLKTYRNRTSNLMDIVRHSVGCFQRSARVYGKSKLSSSIDVVMHFNEYISFRLLGVKKFSDQLLVGNRMQLKKEFMSDHLVALDLLNRCPAIAKELGVTEWDKYQLMKERNASYEYGLCLQARAEALNM